MEKFFNYLSNINCNLYVKINEPIYTHLNSVIMFFHLKKYFGFHFKIGLPSSLPKGIIKHKSYPIPPKNLSTELKPYKQRKILSRTLLGGNRRFIRDWSKSCYRLDAGF